MITPPDNLNPIQQPQPPIHEKKSKAWIWLLALLLLLALGAGGYYWFMVRDTDTNPAPQNNGNQNNQDPGTNTYTNSKYGFQITFAKNYQFKDEADEKPGSSMFLRNGILIARIDILRETYPNTNLSEAWIDMVVGKDMVEADCYKYIGGADAQVPMTVKETINGVQFTKADVSGVGAGNIYETRLYRVFRNNVCYEVALSIHTTQVGNYPEGTVTEVNKDDVWKKLDTMLKTYKFTGPIVVDPSPTSSPTTGTLNGRANLGQSKITTIVVYNSTGQIEVSRKTVDASGNYSITLAPGNYMIDYVAAPDLYPHTKEPFAIKAGETHEFNFILE